MSIALKQVFNKDKTFRPKRKFEPGTQRFDLHKRAQASLSSGLDLRAAVKLPQGEDLNDWVAVHVVDFFNLIHHPVQLYSSSLCAIKPTILPEIKCSPLARPNQHNSRLQHRSDCAEDSSGSRGLVLMVVKVTRSSLGTCL
uniref:Uncharacterized protein n=1 Tax=Sinocyclocheilus anshuiensis TaxID=1608454 RepID=A0A671S070_9TELE